MKNFVYLVGKVRHKDVVKLNDNISATRVFLEIERSYKNNNGVYEIDLIPVYVKDNLGLSTRMNIKKNDVICVKGNIQNYSKENNNDIDYKDIIIADNITFFKSLAEYMEKNIEKN